MTDHDEEHDDDHERTVVERLAERSRLLAFLWRVTEFSRIVSATLCFLGPWFVLVSWLFDSLQHSFDPNHHPDTLKQWHFYVVLGLILVGVTLPIWRLCEWGRDRLLNHLDADLPRGP